MSIYVSRSGEITVGVDAEKAKAIKKLDTTSIGQKRKLNSGEETTVRSRIGALQCYATLIRPDLCIQLSRALSHLNRDGDTDTMALVNKTIRKFEEQRFHFHKITPKKLKSRYMETHHSKRTRPTNRALWW